MRTESILKQELQMQADEAVETATHTTCHDEEHILNSIEWRIAAYRRSSAKRRQLAINLAALALRLAAMAHREATREGGE